MNLWHIAWSYLWNRKVSSIITILCVALGVGLISAVLTLREETRKRFEEEGQAFDLVIGGKGSPLQLVLSCVYFMDDPNQNIKYSVYEDLKKNDDVSAAYPIGLGDTYKGNRIVGTSRDLFDHVWVNAATGEERRPFQLADGRFFDKPMEAVIGGTVAQQLNLTVGSTFSGTHAWMDELADEDMHKKFPYTVVGVLKQTGTPFDRAIFCQVDSVWRVHGHGGEEHAEGESAGAHPEGNATSADASHAGEAGQTAETSQERELSGVLVQLKSPGDRWSFKEYVNDEVNAMAAVPVEEIRKLYDELLGAVKVVLLAVGYLVVVVSALSIMATLYLAILQRRRDLAIMRALGAAPSEIFGAVVLEAFWVTILGVAGGWLLGNVVSYGLGIYLTQRFGMTISAFGLNPEEIRSYAIVSIVGLLAGILPAWQAYQTDVARDLAEL